VELGFQSLVAIALSVAAGALLLRLVARLPSSAPSTSDEDRLTSRLSEGAWISSLVRLSSGAALVLALVARSFTVAALAALAFALVLAWTAVPVRRLADLGRQWADSAEAPDAPRLARAERLDLALASGAALFALAALGALVVG
jgi:hypothetical protein